MYSEGAPSHNPNVDWLNTRGMWTIYCLILLMFHLFLLSIPIDALTVPVVWTLTNVLHNLFSPVLFHFTKGTPWLDSDQGRSRALTFWEQIDDGIQYTTTKKFFTILPIVLFLMTGFYTNYDQTHFVINTISLISVLLPKLPVFHRLRLFDFALGFVAVLLALALRRNNTEMALFHRFLVSEIILAIFSIEFMSFGILDHSKHRASRKKFV